MVQGLGHELPKLVARVRFPAAAPFLLHRIHRFSLDPSDKRPILVVPDRRGRRWVASSLAKIEMTCELL